jgi:hypothetical protein
MMKQGSATANTLGVLAVMYSGFGVLLSWGRGSDDELNTLAAATATGLLYKCTGESLLLKVLGPVASLKVSCDKVLVMWLVKKFPVFMEPKESLKV